jgi:hypothetical protein
LKLLAQDLSGIALVSCFIRASFRYETIPLFQVRTEASESLQLAL